MKRIEPKPFIAQSLRIRVLREHSMESVCLRAKVLGCNVPKGKTCYLILISQIVPMQHVGPLYFHCTKQIIDVHENALPTLNRAVNHFGGLLEV